jgi:hypothetical protein
MRAVYRIARRDSTGRVAKTAPPRQQAVIDLTTLLPGAQQMVQDDPVVLRSLTPTTKGKWMPHVKRLAGSLAASLILVAGCGGGDHFLFSTEDAGAGGSDMAGREMHPSGADMAMHPYPAGPYGNQIGDTMRDVTLQGYRLTRAQTDSTQLTWSNITLSDYHNNPRCKCMLITVGALWCSACQQEQPQLIQDAASDNNFCVLGIVQEGQNPGQAATHPDVDVWTQNFRQNFFVALGNITTNHYFDGYTMGNPPSIGLPFNLVITPPDMKIVDSWQGYDPNGHSHALSSCGVQ